MVYTRRHEEGGPAVDWSEWPEPFDRGGLLFHGDNKEVLAHLLATGFRGKVDVVYIDPPFDSGADYVRKVQLRGASGSARIDGEIYTLGEQIQYTDIWANDTYLQFMYERLLLIKELMSVDSKVVLHSDYHRTHQLRMLMDEVFGAETFANELIWHYPYDGEVFDVDLIDVPERRADLVDGAYELDARADARPAAVRITDMLGEEILVVEAR